ncbi:MAG: ABC transporter permease [Phyllobacterium sp.]
MKLPFLQQPGFLECCTTAWRVIVAVVLRETKTRFGQNKLGYLWAIIEPVAYVAILLFIRSHLHSSIPFGENLFVFFITGILVYRTVMAIAGRTMKAITANSALLTYPLVKPMDTVLARIILEALTMLFVFGVFFVFLAFVSEHEVIHYPSRFAAAIAAAIFLGAGVGTFNAVVSVLFPVWERLWSILGFPLLMLSGIFYLPHKLPPAAQNVLYLNPILHCVEWLRYATYLDYAPMLNRSYVIGFAVVSMTVGMLLERVYRFSVVRP